MIILGHVNGTYVQVSPVAFWGHVNGTHVQENIWDYVLFQGHVNGTHVQDIMIIMIILGHVNGTYVQVSPGILGPRQWNPRSREW